MNPSARSFPWIKNVGIALGLILLIGGGFAWLRTPQVPAPAVLSTPKALTTPADTDDKPRGPQVWAIAIGIDQYNDDAIPPPTERVAPRGPWRNGS